jgi:serine phosphatase RsbU (regulator of sigma subunit)
MLAAFMVWYGVRMAVRFLPFEAPVAYALMDDHLFVVEHGNRVLDLLYDPSDQTLTLENCYEVEQDDGRYYYQVRALSSCEHGVMVRTYIYDDATRIFRGYRYREYDHSRKATDVLTVYFEDVEEFPEIYYAHGVDGSHLFLSGCVGYPCVWRVPAGGGVVMSNGADESLVEMSGPVNTELNPWNALLQVPDGTLYLSSVGRGQVFPMKGGKLLDRPIGTVGIEPGELLAPRDLMYLAFGDDTNRYLTVASQGNRCWVQFDEQGRVVRTVSPLMMDYPYPDILVAELMPGPDGSWLTCDLISRAFLRLGPDDLSIITGYTERRWGVSAAFIGAALLLLAFAVIGFARRWFLYRGRIPFVVKMLLFFVPLLIVNALLVGWRVEDALLSDQENEYVLRSANLARAVLNNVSIDDLDQIRRPADRESELYDRIYSTVNSIIDRREAASTPKWIIHKIHNGRYYFGINIWRGPIYEPYVIPAERRMFYDVLESKSPAHGRFHDEQGEWFSHLTPITNSSGRVDYVLELYRSAEEMDRASEEARNRLLGIVLYSMLITTICVFVFSRYLVRPLQALARGVHSVSAGDFEHRVDLRTRDEIGALSHDFNRMVGQLKQYMANLQRTTAAKERIESDIRMARDVQQGIIPGEFPPFADLPMFEICARIEPAREVGGDFYDFFEVDEQHYGVVVADVSGKGMPAGLFMMAARTILRGNARKRPDAAATISWVNRLLAADNPSMMFVTMFYMVINKESGAVNYCNGGHNPPYIIRKSVAGTEVEQLPMSGNMLVGVEEEATFESGRFVLGPGESVVLYTDGVTEPIDPEGTMFGEERLEQLLRDYAEQENQVACDGIYQAVSRHQQGLEPFDDFTLLFFKRLDFPADRKDGSECM